jgi:hypothetical protein
MPEELSYPIGTFVPDPSPTPEKRETWVRQIAALPEELRHAVRGLDAEKLDTPYRDGGWTVRQVVHHLADSHLNAFMRVKLALTEQTPLIRAYDQKAWAALPDGKTADIGPSLAILDGLHARWVTVIKNMSAADWGRGMKHPERGPLSQDFVLQLYAWHSLHHVAHISSLRERKGWG